MDATRGAAVLLGGARLLTPLRDLRARTSGGDPPAHYVARMGSTPEPGDRPNRLADLGEVMSQVARSLQEEHGDVSATLEAITRAAVDAVPGADECGITLVTHGHQVESRAPTGELPREIDLLQQRLGEGPCIDAVWEQPTVRIEDI